MQITSPAGVFEAASLITGRFRTLGVHSVIFNWIFYLVSNKVSYRETFMIIFSLNGDIIKLILSKHVTESSKFLLQKMLLKCQGRLHQNVFHFIIMYKMACTFVIFIN